MPVTITGTAADPTTSPQTTGAADGDAGTSANLAVTPLQPILNFIAWLRADGVSAPTANKSIRRDAAGRAQVVDPSVAADIDTKGARDAAIAAVSTGTVTINTGWVGTEVTLKKSGSVVAVQLKITAASTPAASWVGFATIPAGYRPPQAINFFGFKDNGGGQQRTVRVQIDGATGLCTVSVEETAIGTWGAVAAPSVGQFVIMDSCYVATQ